LFLVVFLPLLSENVRSRELLDTWGRQFSFLSS